MLQNGCVRKLKDDRSIPEFRKKNDTTSVVRVCQLLQGRRVHESFDVLISFTNNSMYRTRYLPNDPTFCRHPRARSGSPCQCRSQTEWSKVWTRNKARQTLTLSSARPIQEDYGNKQTEKKKY